MMATSSSSTVQMDSLALDAAFGVDCSVHAFAFLFFPFLERGGELTSKVCDNKVAEFNKTH